MFGRRRALEEMRHKIERIEAALVVHDLDTARSVEAYDGLRKQINSAVRNRRTHLAQLVELTDSLERGATVDTLTQRVEEWRLQAGLHRIDDLTDPSMGVLFEGYEGDRYEYEVTEPAWVAQSDEGTSMPVRRGAVKRTGVVSKESSQQAVAEQEAERTAAIEPANDVESAGATTEDEEGES